jgi:hypothetical protein
MYEYGRETFRPFVGFYPDIRVGPDRAGVIRVDADRPDGRRRGPGSATYSARGAPVSAIAPRYGRALLKGHRTSRRLQSSGLR